MTVIYERVALIGLGAMQGPPKPATLRAILGYVTVSATARLKPARARI